jgi:hypothetical protein
MTIIEDANANFDLSDLEYSPGKNLNLCAFELKSAKENTILVSDKLKNIAPILEEGVKFTMEQFKYHAKFDGIIVQAMVPFDDDKYLAVASIDELQSFLPKNVNLDVNKDLMGVAFDAFVVNRGNKNGHIISTDVALAMVENFVNKPFNIEHNRKTVVGFCTGYGFSEFGTSNPLTLEQVKAMTEPFNVVLSGYVWKIVNPEFASELVESSDPSSNNYLSVSASWELGFNEFNIAIGSKNLAEATIIDDPEQIMSLKNDLKVFGGSGVKDGNLLLLNLQGSVLPLGIGFTNNPAAEVKGVVVTYDTPKIVESNEEDIKMNKKSVSSTNEDVKKTMQINQIEDITEEAIKEVTASAVRDFISSKIGELAKDWASKLEEKENALATTEEQLSTLKAELEAIKTDSEKLKAELSEIQDNVQKQEIEATFQRRMSLIDEEFELNDADREIIAEDLHAIQDEEAFTKWYNRFSTIASGKKKSAKVQLKSEEQVMNDSANNDKETAKVASQVSASDESVKEAPEVKEEAPVTEEKTVEQVVSDVEAEASEVPNTATPQEISLVEKISAAFNKNSVKIKR